MAACPVTRQTASESTHASRGSTLTPASRPARIGIFYPSDPAGHVPSGIDSFVKGILKFAPPDLEYLLFGATSDAAARPVGTIIELRGNERVGSFLPLAEMSADGTRGWVPLTVRYLAALRVALRSGAASGLDILDFHRIEPLLLLGADPRPKNLLMHQDMSVVRDKNSDILWRHAPGVYEYIERRLLRRTDRVYCVRKSAVDRYRATYPEIASRIQFIPTWVDTEVFRPAATTAEASAVREEHRRQIGVSSVARLLVFVGRLDRQKDPLLLLDAYARCAAADPSLHLVVIGNGALHGEVATGIATRSLSERVTLLGALGAANIAGWLKAADLFVLSSAYEGMPIAVLEALACGLPVASTDVGEIRRVVRDGQTGRIATARDATRLGDAMALALADAAAEAPQAACVAAIQPYRPEIVLATLYDNHRRQVAERAA
jgi:glycosyltransferase involved in cell wall biosynthesis